MPKKQTAEVQLVEWDGDRYVSGGFKIVIKLSNQLLQLPGSAYDSPRQRRTLLRRMRNRTKKVAKALGFKVKENLLM